MPETNKATNKTTMSTTTTTSAAARSTPTRTSSLSDLMGPALSAVIVLRDWERYGLAERICYHFDLSQALAASEQELQDPNQTNLQQSKQQQQSQPVCGVACLLECIPWTSTTQDVTRKQRRALRAAMLRFNTTTAKTIFAERRIFCHEPPTLPLRLMPTTRVFFGYETTRIAFCLDASPTLTSTFGFGNTGSSSNNNNIDNDDSATACCPMDRLAAAVHTFWTALVQPIAAPAANPAGIWKPILAVSVLAVYPQGPPTLLVRDFRVTDTASAELLAQTITEWALQEVEAEIAKRTTSSQLVIAQSSSLKHILDAAGASLSTLSSTARPCIVVATDGCCVACDGVADIMLTDKELIDVPITVLDLSSPTAHETVTANYHHHSRNSSRQHRMSSELGLSASSSSFNLMSFDAKAGSLPLHLSDDTEALHNICKMTGGAFWDALLLKEAANTKAGQVDAGTPLSSDHFFAFPRHSMKPNAVQWYTFFGLSQLSPRHNSSWGSLTAPTYIREKSLLSNDSWYGGTARQQHRPRSSSVWTATESVSRGSSFDQQQQRTNKSSSQIRTVLSSYIINPIPIKGLLMMRVREGFRAKQYGQSTNDPDKVSMVFTLRIDLGVVLHYELSYKASPLYSHMIGFAHVKIELSGEPTLIQMVKTDFVRGSQGRPTTTYQRLSDRICTLLRSMRREDMLQSYLSPAKWTDQLASSDTPFVRRLGSLSELQQRRHFRFDEFDCVCVGRMPYEQDDDGFLSEFQNTDDGSAELITALTGWSSQIVSDQNRFVKQTRTSPSSLPAYCVVEVQRSPVAWRLWTITVEMVGGSGASDRLSLLVSLKELLGDLNNVRVLPTQMANFLVGVKKRDQSDEFVKVPGRCEILESHHNHATWDLVMDPELIPLLMKRRKEIGDFLLLESSDDHALFAKFTTQYIEEASGHEPGDLVQYQLTVLGNRVVVDLHMESEGGHFFRRKAPVPSVTSKFHRMAKTLRKRDQECALALQCRTSLLLLFDEESSEKPSDQLRCVQSLLEYASTSTIRLLFFHESSPGANEKLSSLTEQMLLSQTLGPKIAKLDIDSSISVSGKVPGDWFIVEYDDKHTISFIHIARKTQPFETEVDSDNSVASRTRTVSFYTVGIGDLYSRRDDIADDGSDDDHISEHMCVTELAELVELGHKRNYASAAYLSAVDSYGKNEPFSFQQDDLKEVMDQLMFVEVARVLVGGETCDRIDDRSKFLELIETLLAPIPGDEFCFMYKHREQDDVLFHLDDDESSFLGSISTEDPGQSAKVDDEELSGPTTHSAAQPSSMEESLDADTLMDELHAPRSVGATPVFVRFLVDDVPASVRDLSWIKQSTNLAALVSVFADSSERKETHRNLSMSDLPSSHVNVVAEIGSLLNAFVAEQTIERLRRCGPTIEDHDLRLARMCLRKARNAVTSTDDIIFYVSRVDKMVPASAPARADAEIEEGFKMLQKQLLLDDTIVLREFGDGSGYLTLDATESGGSILPYICFLSIRKTHGVVAVEAYHPEGIEEGSKIIKRFQRSISRCCHRTNQILLLNKLHNSKSASSFLLAPDSEGQKKEDAIDSIVFNPGYFECPVVFETTFDLFHRCATNPEQVARTIEATVLHIFGVSNRRGIFVYKDEDGAVFYMKLVASGGGLEPDGTIQLLVHGLDKPGPSVTEQLRRLLQKRLYIIAVDMLASVLAKNPRYYWRHADIDFVRSFESEWSEVEDTIVEQKSPHIRRYSFPRHVHDPGMVLIYFRQNLCGSSYFHPLAFPEGTGPSNKKGTAKTLGLSFYYNNSPTKLDPKVQALSTLTKKGAEYSRQTGAGIAIIELILVDSERNQLPELPVLTSPTNEDEYTDADSLRVKLIEGEADNERKAGFVEVRIDDTALKRDVLHDWVRLSLDQVLVAWTVERHLERQQRGILRPVPQQNNEDAKKHLLDTICPGLPALMHIFESSYKLPHPAILKVQYDGVVRSSVVATYALQLLEGVVLDQILLDTKAAQNQDFGSNLCIIRLSRNESPRLVELSWDSKRHNAIVSLVDSRMTVRDTPIDCPEYIMYYHVPFRDADSKNEIPPRLFEGVVVDDGTGESSEVLAILDSLKERNPFAFYRSFAFVLSVKRNKRSFISYNWSIQLFEKTVARLGEKEKQLLALTSHSTDLLQQRSLSILAPLINKGKKRVPAAKSEKTFRNEKVDRKEISGEPRETSMKDIVERERRRRLNRPVNIRRPKLVGKSVEGGALHAVAASRARASSNMFRGSASASSSVASARKGGETSGRKMTASRSRAGAPSQVSERKNQQKTSVEDKEVISFHKFYESALPNGPRRLHAEHVKTTMRATKSFWPIRPPREVLTSISELVLHENSMVGTDAAALLPLPRRLVTTFPARFAQSVVTCSPELSVVPVRFQGQPHNHLYLAGEVRAVHTCKCMSVAQVSVINVSGGAHEYALVLLQTYLLILPRREKDRRRMTKSRRYNPYAFIEKDAAGTDLLAHSMNEALQLQKALFDHAASTAERSLKSVEGELEYGEVLSLLNALQLKYSLCQQRIMLRSNYKCFGARIVLDSYENPVISKYDAPTLFRWLSENCVGQTMILCDQGGLCFKREVVVAGTSSVCFLSPDSESVDSLWLVILCRTQGKDLHDFMFREESNVAISVVDNIAVECAGLAYQELQLAAKTIQRDSLWKRVAEPRQGESPTLEHMEQLLGLCFVKPISYYLKAPNDLKSFYTIINGDEEADWSENCETLRSEPSWSPSWPLGSTKRIFYSANDDVFIILFRREDDGKTSIDLVEREEKSSSRSRSIFAIQRLLNLFLFSVWDELVVQR